MPTGSAVGDAIVARGSRWIVAILESLQRYSRRTALAGLRTFGRTIELAVEAFRFMVVDIVRLRFPWREALGQASFMASVSAPPALLISIPFGVIVLQQVGSLTAQIGATSMSGAAGGVGIISQAAPMVSALLLGGAAGAAVAADLGARTVREEIDALKTMGINPAQRLVAPRIAAMLVVAPLLCLLIIFVGIGTIYVLNVTQLHGSPGSFLSAFAAFARPVDLWIAMIKSTIMGVLVIIVACQRGIEARGGPRGVADAVNAAVVVSVLLAIIANLVITQVTAMFFPPRIG
ncbi:ABC transporter permease [Nocardia uniformis]|uniref:ABC transporter permease n=2 Tax=Nocardia uniformis TaxID=53432 RepID=A0A849BZZ9_9NOCA|nr:ABC transporter permease [Nocardia uniformis]NNH70918.1 ABC transporter permease [Nocardia uniformis]